MTPSRRPPLRLGAVTLLAACGLARSEAAPVDVVICADSVPALGACEALTAHINASPLMSNHTWSCVEHDDHAKCLDQLTTNPESMVFDTTPGIVTDVHPVDAFFSQYELGASIIAAEHTPLTIMVGGMAAQGASVAVTPAFQGLETLADLKGARACHNYYDDTAGWHLPLGALAEGDVLVPTNYDRDVPNDLESHEALFSTSCVPGAKVESSGVCGACDPDCSVSAITAGDDGAMAALKLGRCDVAFVSHKALAGLDASDWKLLCPPAHYKETELIGEWATESSGGTMCNFGIVPPNAIVAHGFSVDELADIRLVLEEVQTADDFLATHLGVYTAFGPETTEVAVLSDPAVEYFGPSFWALYHYNLLHTIGLGERPVTPVADPPDLTLYYAVGGALVFVVIVVSAVACRCWKQRNFFIKLNYQTMDALHPVVKAGDMNHAAVELTGGAEPVARRM